MGFWIFMLVVDLLIPFSLMILGMIYIYRPPKKINQYSGYRTAMSMKNLDTWIFAHRKFGKILVPVGSILFIVAIGISVLLFNLELINISIFGGVEVFFQFIAMVISAILVEKSLRKNFDENGNRLL